MSANNFPRRPDGRKQQRYSISIVVTLHREGPLASRTLQSISTAYEIAQSSGIYTQCILACDDADDQTRNIANHFSNIHDGDWVLIKTSNKDLSKTRNEAIGISEGEYIAIFDGDDLMAPTWLTDAYGIAKSAPAMDIFHPEYVINFGATNGIYRQISQDASEFERSILFSVNLWNSCSFASKDIYKNTPYALIGGPKSGFGFEDWHWNCETIAKGCNHRVVPGSTHFVRKKSYNSLSTAQADSFSLIGPTKFLGAREA